MSRAVGSPDVRWCRSSPTGWGLLSRGAAHNTPGRAAPGRPTCSLGLACLLREKSPCASLLWPLTILLRYQTQRHIPDGSRVFGDGAGVGELSGASHVQDGLTEFSE